MNELIGCLIKLVDMIAKVLRRGQLEKIGIKCGHVGLNMIEEVGLHEVATVDTDGDLLKELGDSQTLRADALLDQAQLVCGSSCCGRVLTWGKCCVKVESFNRFLRETEAVKRVKAEIGLAHIVNNEH